MQQHIFFVWKKPAGTRSFRVVHREVKQRTRKGYPISFILKALPEEFESWERAQRVADRLNRGEMRADTRYLIEEAEIE